MRLTVVLHQPQDLVNIASVVRVMKNFALRDLTLVDPAEFEPRRITGIAHGSDDLVRRISIVDDLDTALADCTHVVGMTARQRAAKRNMQRPNEAAYDLLTAAQDGVAALVLGREDKGLSNDDLDRCHRVVTISTAEDYAALNLSHAFTVMAYELFSARHQPAFKSPRRISESATHEQFEQFFDRAEDALAAIEFFKTRNTGSIMRTVREVAHRTPMDAREVNLFKAMCVEVVRFLERKGVK
ncbi:MAG: TrmJ/YjtD family RNA methyltransferase [Gemmatimonadota bacterium]|nr:MAG: TrmJ/YjtD family RNA methyltransferase [Gemmatimonadota bacterium]